MTKSICIVRLSALGDVLMLVPLIRTLQAHLTCSITWVISRPAYDLVEGLEGVEFIVVDKPNRLADYWRFKKHMQDRPFDILLATQASFRANLLYPLIKATRKIGYDSARAKDGHGWFVRERIAPGYDHTLEGFLKFADVLGVHQKEISWDVPIPKSAHDWAMRQKPATKGPWVLINPAASKPERTWSADRYVQVIQHLQKRWQAHVVLVGGPGAADRSLGDAIGAGVQVTDLIGQSTPKELLALILLADVLLSPDTGPSHMASAVGTPVVALHAVTSSKVSGSYRYLDLTVDCYPEAMKRLFKKDSAWGTQAHGEGVMGLVRVEAVVSRLDEVLKGLGFSNPLSRMHLI
ncbi:MAG: glycosyltransferase family 9 protein [Legionellales bacterium]|nr:glycosyltransferase family 9 protein [Legionellales bacterium]